MDTDTLGRRLKVSRLRLAAAEVDSISPEALGLRVGVAGQTISRYESGTREPDLAMIRKLCAILRVAPGWLAFGDEAMAIPDAPAATVTRRGSKPAPVTKLARPAVKRHRKNA